MHFRRMFAIAMLSAAALVQLDSATSAQTAATTEDCQVGTDDRQIKPFEAACTRLLRRSDLSDTQRAEAYLLRGIDRFRRRRIEEAIADFGAGLLHDQGNHRLHRLRGLAAYEVRDMEGAFAHVRRSIEIYPEGPEAYFVLADLHRYYGQGREALASLNRAIELEPGHAYARYNRAGLLVASNRHVDALPDTTWLVAQSREDLARFGTARMDGRSTDLLTGARITHAKILGRLMRTDEAEAIMNQVVAEVRDAVTLSARSEFYGGLPIGLGKPSRMKDALADAELAVQLDSDYAQAWVSYAIALQYSKRPAEALVAIDQAIELSPPSGKIPPLLWNRSRMLMDLDRKAEAIETRKVAFEVAFVMTPSSVASLTARLAQNGYWMDRELPTRMTSELTDAITACLMDRHCF